VRHQKIGPAAADVLPGKRAFQNMDISGAQASAREEQFSETAKPRRRRQIHSTMAMRTRAEPRANQDQISLMHPSVRHKKFFIDSYAALC